MAALTTGVLAAGVALKGQRDVKKAQQAAAQGQADASMQSAAVLAMTGKQAARDVERGRQLAEQQLAQGMETATGYIDPYTQATRGYDIARRRIMEQGQVGGPLANMITGATMQGASHPMFGNLGDPVTREMQRQAGINVSAFTPDITAAQLTQGQQGIAALGDIAGIRRRGYEGMSGLAERAGASRASALIGQVPALQQLGTANLEAGLLSDIAGHRANKAGIDTLLELAGRVI